MSTAVANATAATVTATTCMSTTASRCGGRGKTKERHQNQHQYYRSRNIFFHDSPPFSCQQAPPGLFLLAMNATEKSARKLYRACHILP
jgi:hypothetical protein